MNIWKAMHDALSQLAYEWNDLEYEPDERGRGNDALVLVITEEGQGFIGRAGFPRQIPRSNLFEFVLLDGQPEVINSQCEFENAEQLTAYFKNWYPPKKWEISRRRRAFERDFDDLRDELIAEEQTRLDMREE